MIWHIQNWLARRFGFWTYGGLCGYHPQHWPVGHVCYPDRLYSRAMPLGNAWGYARMFGGVVIRDPVEDAKSIRCAIAGAGWP